MESFSPTVVPLLRLLLSQAVDEINADTSILPSSRLVVSVTKTEKDHSLEDLEAVVLGRLATGNIRSRNIFVPFSQLWVDQRAF